MFHAVRSSHPSTTHSRRIPSKDSYGNNRQLNVIVRAILIHPDLVNLWKEIGYNDINNNVN
ncbi:10865_t:CDS:2 [Funneliformis geosporum]|nr:10865_t:CDS:2 [Funneliformis geosporum]